MKRFLTGFFLPLCIFLLGGYGQRYAFAYQGATQFSAIRLLEKSRNQLGAGTNSQTLVVKSALPEKKTFRLDIAPFEEDEVREYERNSSKKHSGASHIVIPITYVRIIGYFLGHAKKSLLFCKHFSNIASYKWYLVFQVFRL